VQLRGVGASDLTDLVTMRESMFVVQVGSLHHQSCFFCLQLTKLASKLSQPHVVVQVGPRCM
jgi:hypothetical protein